MNDTNCIFCKIANKVIATDIVTDTDNFFVIADISPKTKTHLLIISKEHFEDFNELMQNKNLHSEYIELILKLNKNLQNPTHKLTTNTGKTSGQEVFHFHTHFTSSSALKSTAFA